jgi:phospholipase C
MYGLRVLPAATQVVLANDRFVYHQSESDRQVMAAVHRQVKHVIFILKENRPYDQILVGLASVNGNPFPNNIPAGDSDLTLFGAGITAQRACDGTEVCDAGSFLRDR